MDWIALFFSITGLWFNGKKSMWCWPCWFASNLLWASYAIVTRQPSLLVLQVFFFVFNLIGWRRWKHDAKQQVRDGFPEDYPRSGYPTGGREWQKTLDYSEGTTFEQRDQHWLDFQSRDRTRRDKYGNPR